jgi:hypothetical protein
MATKKKNYAAEKPTDFELYIGQYAGLISKPLEGFWFFARVSGWDEQRAVEKLVDELASHSYGPEFRMLAQAMMKRAETPEAMVDRSVEHV